MSDPTGESSGSSLPLHGFLGERQPFFVSYHQPTGQALDTAYLICPPLGYEAIQSYAAMRVLAEELACAGFATARIDYPGTGESAGSDEDPKRVDAWLNAVRDAARALHMVEAVKSVGIVGVRMGGLLAARVAAEVEAAFLVLWEPVVTGSAYTRELEIMGSVSMKALMQDTEGTGTESLFQLEAGGYGLTAETVDDLGVLSLESVPPPLDMEVLLVVRDDRPASSKLEDVFSALGCVVETARLPGFREMMVAPAASRLPREMLDAILEWVSSRDHAASDKSLALSLYRSRVEDGVLHEPLRFGPGGRLFGMMSSPIGAAGDDLTPRESASTPITTEAVVVLAGGVVPRTAVNRMYVPLAHRLAVGGRRVLRVDVSGICESPPEHGARLNDAYPPSLLSDTRHAVDALPAGCRVWLVGLCSGAYAAFQASLDADDVVGVVLINPLVFTWQEGLSLDSPTVQQFMTSPGRSEGLNVDRWRRLIAGDVDIAGAVAIRLATLRTRLRSGLSRMGQRLGTRPKGLAADLHGLLDRGTTVAIGFSERDPGHRALMNQLSGREIGLERAGMTMDVFPGADHTFSAFGPRASLLDWVLRRMQADQDE